MPAREVQVRRDSQLFSDLCSAILRRGNRVAFRADGASMQPNLREGDEITVAPAQAPHLNRGDIALVRNADGICAHRVIRSAATPGELLLRSDTSWQSDPSPTQLFGKIILCRSGSREESFDLFGTSTIHWMRRVARRLRMAAANRLRRAGGLFAGTSGVLLLALLATASSAQAQADLSITQTPSVTSVDTGVNFTYTEVATNAASSVSTVPANTLVVYQQTPANTVFEAITATNWTCIKPAAGAAGQIICTFNNALAKNTSANAIVITLQVNAGTAYGTTILNSASVTSQTTDPNPTNNTSLSTVYVEQAGQSDLGVSISATPTPVFVFTNYVYSVVVQNLGQSAAPIAANVLTITLPAGVSFVSSAPPAGWTCSGTGPVKCSISAAMAVGASSTINVTVTAPAAPPATPLTATAVVNLAGDPNANNNSASVISIVQPLVCATPGRDGTPGAALTGVVNAYYAPSATGTLAAGATSVGLGAAAAGGAQTPIAAGDLLLIMQMQDATINSTNTGAYGDGTPGDPATGSTALGSSGLFEFVTATNSIPVTGGTLQFLSTGSGNGLLNSYVQTAATTTQPQQTFQVIRVPQYLAATLSSTLVPMAWNGATGGVLALDVSAQLTLGGTVSADALGFRAGGGKILAGGAGANTDYVTLATNAANASKGEGIAGTPRFLAPATIAITTVATDNTGGAPADSMPSGSFARGAPGNAGGGGTDGHPAGNDFNSGGGAGGNGGAGGVGGYGWNSFSVVNNTNGGFGGAAFPASTSALVMGGGGGAGSTNDGSYYVSGASNGADCGANCTGIFSSGGYGGGIVIVHAGSVTGTGTITANGQNTLSTLNDSTGGAGAGGSIIFFANSGTIAGLTVSANGGSAGNAWPIKAPTAFSGNRHGPGGGGGGGVIFLSGAPAASSVSGGSNGFTNTVQDSYGATPGQNGVVVNTHIITENPGAQAGAYCAGADLTVSSNTAVPTVVAPGGNIVYTQVVQNLGPMAAVNAIFSETVPANTTFQAIATPAGWTCMTPAVGGTGNITCTNPLVASGASSTFTITVNVGAATTSGTQIVDVANITSGTNDPNLANNSATAIVTVGAANTADLMVTNTPSSPTVAAGTNYTLTGVVNNLSTFAAATPTFQETTPPNTTFVSLVAPAGWKCNTPIAGGTGLIYCNTIATTFAGGASATFPVILNVNAATPSGTQVAGTATASSSTPDPNPTNNSATGTITVATAGQVDLAVTSTAAPNPVSENNNITYTQAVLNNGPIAATNATFTEAIPANTTLVSFPTPAGWTCLPVIAVGGTGTFTCTLNVGQTIAVNASVSFPLVVKVNPTTPPGTIITNTPTVSSTTGDPNPANNSATTKVTVASPSQADVSILKTASPEPVNQGTNLTYTLQVTNGGPAVAQGVTVTDTLPGEVTYTSSFTSQGSCALAAGTVTCTLGSLSVGSTAVITINVNATTFSSVSTSTNTATVSATTSDPNLTNNSSTAISTIQSPTAVDISYFHAFSQPDGTVLLEWRTHEESRNLGFHIYREQAGQRTRINPSLIAGSALLLRGSKPQHAAKTYRWIDKQPAPGASYSIEDLDINGTHTTHGPVSAETGTPLQSENVAAQRQSALLAQLRPAAHAASRNNLRIPFRPVLPRSPVASQPVNLDDLPALKIAVDHEGWYRVSSAQIAAAGLMRGGDLRWLHLYAEGVEQPVLFSGSGENAADPFDGIEFYGTPIDTPFSGQRSYWLVRENHHGNPISRLPALSGGTTAPGSFPFEVLREDRTTYFAALLNGENNDNFFGATITTDPAKQELDVTHFDGTSPLPITLDLTIQGAVDGWEHLINVELNGVTLGTMDFIGLKLFSQTFTVQPSMLQEGANTVTLTALNGDNDVSVVQSIELHYPHSYAADGDWLRATAASGSQLHLTGFSNAQIRAFDITDPLHISELSGKISNGTAAYELELTLSNGGPAERTILAFANNVISSPAGLSTHAPSNLDDRHSGADIVIISYPDFVADLEPLIKLRQSQNYRVQVVTTDQIYDEYNFGERSPFAIRSFLVDATQHWNRKPQYVLLAGGASFDPRNYLGLGEFDFVPTRLIETAAFKTASDDWFTDFTESGFGTIPIGRLPARTSEDVDLLVSKIVNYERGGSGNAWNSQALFIADQNIDADFSGAATSAATAVPASLQVSKLFADGEDAGTAHAQILAALNNGSLLVNYHGHGSEQQWSFSDLLNTNDTATLSNGNRLPVYLLMDCLNGFFQDVYAESLGVSLLMARNGGAVSVWTSSGFTDEAPQASMNLAFFREFAARPTEPIGKIALIAKQGTTDKDVRRTWNLLGDPAMKFQIPTVVHPARTIAPVRNTGLPLKLKELCAGNSACATENKE